MGFSRHDDQGGENSRQVSSDSAARTMPGGGAGVGHGKAEPNANASREASGELEVALYKVVLDEITDKKKAGLKQPMVKISYKRSKEGVLSKQM